MGGADVKLLLGKEDTSAIFSSVVRARSACAALILNHLGPFDSMIILVTILHVIVCLFLIVVVLLQSGKAGDISAAFGGQGSQAAFGPRGAATALSKATTLSAVLFMLTSVTLSIYAIKHSGPSSVLQGVKSAPVKTQPAAPAPANPPTQK
jgi:preprotein translocase subunit SecG